MSCLIWGVRSHPWGWANLPGLPGASPSGPSWLHLLQGSSLSTSQPRHPPWFWVQAPCLAFSVLHSSGQSPGPALYPTVLKPGPHPPWAGLRLCLSDFCHLSACSLSPQTTQALPNVTSTREPILLLLVSYGCLPSESWITWGLYCIIFGFMSGYLYICH